VDDVRDIARRRLPRGVFDYIDGGAEDETTLARNVTDFRRIGFRPRVLRGVVDVDTSATLLGRELPMPVVLAPTGFTRMITSQGELAVARAAERAGLPFALSTLATRSIEEVSEVSSGPKWFQVYVWRDRGMMKSMLERAAAAGFEAIVVTVDTAVFGRRERDIRNGFTLPPSIGIDTLASAMAHPRWTWDLLRSDPIRFANVVGSEVGDGSEPVQLASYINTQIDGSLSWRDIEWIRSVWSGPVIIKGIQTVEDAKIAAESDVHAIAISNHGGRQLDGASSAARLLQPISQAVGGDIELICDGGIRRGSDVVKAVALGADACMIGRPYLFGLAAGGERGVDHVLDLLRDGLRSTMALLGIGALNGLDSDALDFRTSDLLSLQR
jgi:L-lactate dehydrogenase (cytochrome)